MLRGASFNFGLSANEASIKESNSFTSTFTSKAKNGFAMLQNFMFDLTAGWLGVKPVSPEVEQEVRAILDEMNMSDWGVRLKRLSKLAMFVGMTDHNAFAVSLYGIRNIYISEDWYKQLSPEQRRFLIGHEAAHLKYYHTDVNFLFWLVIDLLSLLEFLHYLSGRFGKIFNCKFKLIPDKIGTLKSRLRELSIFFIFKNVFMRIFEVHADFAAATELGEYDGGIALMKEFKAFRDKRESELPQEKIFIAIRNFAKWLRKYIGSHPTHDQRIANIEKWKTEYASKSA